jgi:hypothetical protein
VVPAVEEVMEAQGEPRHLIKVMQVALEAQDLVNRLAVAVVQVALEQLEGLLQEELEALELLHL